MLSRVFGLTENGHDVLTVAGRNEKEILYNTMLHVASCMVDDGWEEDDALLDAEETIASVVSWGGSAFTINFENRGPVTFAIYTANLQ